MLDGLPVLIVEDDVFIGLTLADAVEDAGGLVIGPVATTTLALGLLATTQICAAILDVNVADRDIEPVLNRCMASGTPTVVHSGTGLPPRLASLYPRVPVLLKPQLPDVVVLALGDAVSNRPPAVQGTTRERGPIMS